MPGIRARATGFAAGDRPHPHQDPRLRATWHADPSLRWGRLLFGALNYLEGKLITRLAARHRHQEWLAFLRTIDEETPGDLAIHIIASPSSRPACSRSSRSRFL